MNLTPSVYSTEPDLILDDPGHKLIISDLHIPHHDNKAVEVALKEGMRRKVNLVLINGDLGDGAELSRHEHLETPAQFRHEIATIDEFLGHLRQRFKKARIIFKKGNHDIRLAKFIHNRAKVFEGLPGVNLESMIRAENHGVEVIDDIRLIRLGKLFVVHGHEFKGGSTVAPARWLLNKAKDVALCGHWHRTDFHQGRTIGGYTEAAWTTGCLCHLKPRWHPFNDWNHGFAIPEIFNDGNFHVHNHRMLNGEIV